jgi:predicted kinase
MIALICIGISASGKSTYADKWLAENTNSIEVNRDAYRKSLTIGDGKEWKWKNWNWKRENEVTALCNSDIEYAAKNKFSIIISDTNLNYDRNMTLKAKLEAMGYEVNFKLFDITYEEAVKRDLNRSNPVGSNVIAKMWKQWLEYTDRKKYKPDSLLPNAVMCDIDGTIAEMHDRGPFEWHKVGNDKPKQFVIDVLHGLHHNNKIIFMSGRDSVCRAETMKWLEDNLPFKDYELFMRPEGDMRKDSIVKEELFWEHVAPLYNVKMVFDDRVQVVNLWHDIGLNVFAVGDQRILF